jgi:glutamate synthase (NADPH/NADH) large chain
MMQIKMAQGAKPGEGGQLPGHKVDATSPRCAFDAGRRPDLAAAASRHLFDRGSGAADLRPEERQSASAVSVKLVSEVGVGTVAAGVAKARRPCHHLRLRRRHRRLAADLDQACRQPWEIGLAETHQTLVLNGLRSRIAVQVDGGFAPAATS